MKSPLNLGATEKAAIHSVMIVMLVAAFFAPDLMSQTKKRQYKDVYDDNGLVPFAVEVDGEIYTLVREDKARKLEAELSECRIKLPALEKVDSMCKDTVARMEEIHQNKVKEYNECVSDRRELWTAINKVEKKEPSVWASPQVNQALGFSLCAATFAAWQWSR